MIEKFWFYEARGKFGVPEESLGESLEVSGSPVSILAIVTGFLITDRTKWVAYSATY